MTLTSNFEILYFIDDVQFLTTHHYITSQNTIQCNNFLWGYWLFGQKSIFFCNPPLKTWQPYYHSVDSRRQKLQKIQQMGRSYKFFDFIWENYAYPDNLSMLGQVSGYRRSPKNGILLPKLFWPTVRKNCSRDQEKLLKFEAEGLEFAKFVRSLEQFIQTAKGQHNFW